MAQQFLAKQATSDGFQIPDPRSRWRRLRQALAGDAGRSRPPDAGADAAVAADGRAVAARSCCAPPARRPSPWSSPTGADKRFKDEAWSEELVFDYVKQSYLVASRWIQNTVAEVDNLDPGDQDEGGVLHAAVRGRALAQQLRADQPDRAQARGRDQGREPAERVCGACSTTSTAARATSRSR